MSVTLSREAARKLLRNLLFQARKRAIDPATGKAPTMVRLAEELGFDDTAAYAKVEAGIAGLDQEQLEQLLALLDARDLLPAMSKILDAAWLHPQEPSYTVDLPAEIERDLSE